MRFIAKKQDHESDDCKTVSTVDDRKRVLATNASVSIALDTNTGLKIVRAVPCARFVRGSITPPSANSVSKLVDDSDFSGKINCDLSGRL